MRVAKEAGQLVESAEAERNWQDDLYPHARRLAATREHK